MEKLFLKMVRDRAIRHTPKNAGHSSLYNEYLQKRTKKQSYCLIYSLSCVRTLKTIGILHFLLLQQDMGEGRSKRFRNIEYMNRKVIRFEKYTQSTTVCWQTGTNSNLSRKICNFYIFYFHDSIFFALDG